MHTELLDLIKYFSIILHNSSLPPSLKNNQNDDSVHVLFTSILDLVWYFGSYLRAFMHRHVFFKFLNSSSN